MRVRREQQRRFIRPNLVHHAFGQLRFVGQFRRTLDYPRGIVHPCRRKFHFPNGFQVLIQLLHCRAQIRLAYPAYALLIRVQRFRETLKRAFLVRA